MVDKKRVNPNKGVPVNCLGVCNRKFLSKDRINNRICPECKRKLRDVDEPRVAKFGTHNYRTIPVPHED